MRIYGRSDRTFPQWAAGRIVRHFLPNLSHLPIHTARFLMETWVFRPTDFRLARVTQTYRQTVHCS